MGKPVMILIIGITFGITLYAEEHQLIQLLRHENWIERNKAVYLILSDIEKYKDNSTLTQEVLKTLSNENMYLSLHDNVFHDDGHGEYYLDLLELVIKLDIPGSVKILLDSAGHGNRVENAIVANLLKKENDLAILQSIQEKMKSPDIFYQKNQDAYLRIIRKYLEKDPVISDEKKAIIEDIVFNGILLYDYVAQKNAIECSRYFPELIPEVLPELITRATTATELDIRVASTEALGRLGDPSVLQILTELLGDDEPKIREAAVYALAQLQEASIVSLLIKALSDPANEVRQKAAQHLGQIGAIKAIPYLRRLATKDPYVRELSHQKAETRDFDEQRDGRYYIYPVRRAAREALERLESEDRPIAEPTKEPTVIPAITLAIETQPSPDIQASSEIEHGSSTENTTSIQIVVLVIAVVLCALGYVAYRIKRRRQ